MSRQQLWSIEQSILMYKFKIANKNIFAASVDWQDTVVLQEIKLYPE